MRTNEQEQLSGAGLWVGEDAEEVEQPEEHWQSYLEHLQIYLLGLAMVGTTPLDNLLRMMQSRLQPRANCM